MDVDAKVIRLTCAQHGVLAERVVTKTEFDEADSDPFYEFCHTITTAHRASYGGQCPDEITAETFDGTHAPVFLVWHVPHEGGGVFPQSGRTLMTVVATKLDADIYIEALKLPRTMVLGDDRVRVNEDDMVVAEWPVVHYLEPPSVDPEPASSDEPVPDTDVILRVEDRSIDEIKAQYGDPAEPDTEQPDAD